MKSALAYLTLLVTLAFAIAPAVTAPFSGFRADQLPIPQIDPPIQPEGYAFAIWGLIYTWLVISAIYGAWKRPQDPAWNRARPPLIGSIAIGVPWLAIANASAIWATITIYMMAIFAIFSLLRAPTQDRWLFAAPVGIYAGWLTAASWVSLGSTAAGYGVVADQIGWAYLGIAGASACAASVFYWSRALPYALTAIWALVGIIVANTTSQIMVSAAAASGIVLLAVLGLWMQRSGKFSAA